MADSGVANNLPPLPPLPSLVAQLVTVAMIVLQRTMRHNNIRTARPIQREYDFVIVGSGSAGSVMGARLTQNSSTSVLILEVGGPQTVLSDMPGHERQNFGTEMDWNYHTTSQSPNAGNAFDGHIAIPRGRIVGGSHNINFMVYSRGNPRDYNAWVTDFGATGWSYNEVLPYFLRSENNTDRNLVEANPGFHSTEGPMVVKTPINPDPIITILKEYVLARGYPLVDQNGASQLGINYFQQTIFLNGTRSTTASSFLEANIARPNLQVLTNALATRILFGSDRNAPPRAIGLEYEVNGQTYQVFVRKEVLLCAGSINTPQLLMLSGIGPRDHLTDLGIATRVDLPVGYNLQDHTWVQLDFDVLDPSLITSGTDLSITNMYRYFVDYAAPLAIFPLVFMYLNSPGNNDTNWPDIQIGFNVNPVGNDLEGLVASYREEDRPAWKEYYRDHVGQRNRLGMSCFQYRTRSHGRVYLNTTDPHDAALIDTRYLTDPADVEQLTSAVRLALRLTHTPPFERMIRLWRQPIPGCSLCATGPIWECYSYIECYARAITQTVGHQVGTARMGSGQDSVVDTELRVRGVSGLRVIDGSIFPRITNGNTNAPTIMVAERGAQFIKQQYNV